MAQKKCGKERHDAGNLYGYYKNYKHVCGGKITQRACCSPSHFDVKAGLKRLHDKMNGKAVLPGKAKAGAEFGCAHFHIRKA